MVKENKQKNNDTKNSIYNQYEERLILLNRENIILSGFCSKFYTLSSSVKILEIS